MVFDSTTFLKNLTTQAGIYSLNSGRIQFVPYQYRPVLKLIRADRPRLLIADEVGVGKTIEAEHQSVNSNHETSRTTQCRSGLSTPYQTIRKRP